MSDLDALIDDPEPEPIMEEKTDEPSKLSVDTSTNRVFETISIKAKELLEETQNDNAKEDNYLKLIKMLDDKVSKLDAKLNRLYAEEDHNPATAILLDKISKRLDRKSNKDDVKIIDDKVKFLEKSMKEYVNSNNINDDNDNKNKEQVSRDQIEGFISNEIANRFSELQSILDARLEVMDEKINNIQKSLFSRAMIH